MSDSRISRLRLRSIEETNLIRARPASSKGETGQFGLRVPKIFKCYRLLVELVDQCGRTK